MCFVGNAKFNTTIWQLEEARTVFFMAGFEEVSLKTSCSFFREKDFNINL
jgi:hypothetical protein